MLKKSLLVATLQRLKLALLTSFVVIISEMTIQYNTMRNCIPVCNYLPTSMYTEWLRKLESLFFILPKDVAVFTKKLSVKKINGNNCASDG
jgi:hypothetical protein